MLNNLKRGNAGGKMLKNNKIRVLICSLMLLGTIGMGNVARAQRNILLREDNGIMVLAY